MSDMYSMTKTRDAIRQVMGAVSEAGDRFTPLPFVFPDQVAPVVWDAAGGTRELTSMRWGFPPPEPGGALVTNIGDLQTPDWRWWARREYRCVVPATSFCEYTDINPRTPTWFALDESRPLFFIAGIWRSWIGRRGTQRRPADGRHFVYSLLTCAPNEIVEPVHAQSMPVILTSGEACDHWLTAPTEEALALLQPLPAGAMTIVARGSKPEQAAAE